MSNYAPGWYPDGSGRFAQRYYDGSSWTDHVVDSSGRSALDPVPGVTVPSTQPVSPASSSGMWGQPSALGGDRPSSGTSASSVQFGAAPTHESAYGSAPRGAVEAPAGSGGVRLTVGALVAEAGVVLVALAVFVLAYWSGGGIEVSLGDISEAASNVNAIAGSYASFGRWLGLLAMVGAGAVMLLGALGHAGVVAKRRPLAIAASAAGGVFGLWHLVGLFVAPDSGGPAIAGFVGVVGYAACAASGFLRKPLGNSPR